AFFVTGNHEEFGNVSKYVRALERAGIRVLANEKVTVDGVDIAGIGYHDSMYPMRVRTILDAMALKAGEPNILLHHVPNRMPQAEAAGIALQLCGHTHG